MLKQLFGLASVTVLSGMIVAATGCSSTKTFLIYEDGGEDDGGSGSLADGGRKEAGPRSSDGSTEPEPEPEPTGGTCPTTDPITAADVEAQIQWRAPVAPRVSCNQGNLDALKGLFKNAPAGGVGFADIKASLGATCSSCVFSPIAGANWSVFVEDGPGALDNRTGSCFAQLEGTTCGRSRFQWETCLNAACSETDCGSQNAISACIPKAQAGACKALTGTYAGACPNEATSIDRCGNLFDAIAISCSGGSGHGLNVTP